jgi:hypothetical protein
MPSWPVEHDDDDVSAARRRLLVVVTVAIDRPALGSSDHIPTTLRMSLM